MIDRTDLDLRVAAHQATAATVNAREWRRQGASSRRPSRAVIAAARVALAARLGPAEAAPARAQPPLPSTPA